MIPRYIIDLRFTCREARFHLSCRYRDNLINRSFYYTGNALFKISILFHFTRYLPDIHFIKFYERSKSATMIFFFFFQKFVFMNRRVKINNCRLFFLLENVFFFWIYKIYLKKWNSFREESLLASIFTWQFVTIILK